MPAIDFPNSPSLNQEFSAGGIIYKWSGSTWNIYSSSQPPSSSIVSYSANAPVNPTAGQVWVESDVDINIIDTTNFYTKTEVDGALLLKANLASPTLTGIPSAPTAAAATNTTQIATTAFVRTEISNLVSSAPAALDTLDELAAALGDDANFSTTVTNSIATKAPIASPTLTGTPAAPTAAADTNTTQLATTAFVIGQAASANPLALGSVAVGTSARYARADHVHPTTGLGLTSGTLAQFSATTSSQLAGVISDETGSGSLVFGTSPTLSTPVMLSPEERCNIVAAAATGTINFDILTSTIWFYTSNATADHTLNFRGNAGNTLNSLLAVGDSISLIWLNTNGASAFRPTVFQIDGVSVTPRWSGGTAPTAGNANSVDAYSFSIIKTAATPTYTVLAGQVRFA